MAASSPVFACSSCASAIGAGEPIYCLLDRCYCSDGCRAYGCRPLPRRLPLPPLPPPPPPPRPPSPPRSRRLFDAVLGSARATAERLRAGLFEFEPLEGQDRISW